MDFSKYNLTSEVGVNFDYSLGALDKDKTRFLTDSTQMYVLGMYLALMFYLIGGLNVLKLKFLYPCLEDLCAIYADVGRTHAEKALLPQEHHVPVLHVC